MTAPLFKSLLFSLSKGSFKRYVRPERGWRVANFVTNHYGNYGEVRGVSVMPLRNADKIFILSISRETTYRKLFLVLFSLKNPGI